jgi:hypothetical protein
MRSPSSFISLVLLGLQLLIAGRTSPFDRKPNGNTAQLNSGLLHHIHIKGNENTSDDDSGGGDTKLRITKDDRVQWIDDDANRDYFVCFGLKDPSDPTLRPFTKDKWRVSNSNPADSGPLRSDALPPNTPSLDVFYDVYQARTGKKDCTPPDKGPKGNPKIVIQQ